MSALSYSPHSESQINYTASYPFKASVRATNPKYRRILRHNKTTTQSLHANHTVLLYHLAIIPARIPRDIRTIISPSNHD